MANWAVTMYWLACVTELPVIVPRVTLEGGAPAGGTGVAPAASVKVTSTLAVPWAAEVGLTVVMDWPKVDAATKRSARRPRGDIRRDSLVFRYVVLVFIDVRVFICPKMLQPH